MDNKILTAVNATYGKGMQKEAAAKAVEGTVNIGKRVMDLLNKAKGVAGTVGNTIGNTVGSALEDSGKSVSRITRDMGDKVLLNGALTQPGTLRYKIEDILTNGLTRASDLAAKYPKVVGGVDYAGAAGTGAFAGHKLSDLFGPTEAQQPELPKQASVADILKKAKQQS